MAEKKLKPVTDKNPLVKTEEEILRFWQEHNIFEKSLKQREHSPVFSFYDGPPFATGLPHYGHLVASLMKDIIPRYQTMKGKFVERRWGWDCHGLPVENIVEGELGLKSKKDILKIGIEKFNETCRSKVLTYRAEWRKIIDRFGRWADMDNDYRTMDLSYMESIWWVFKELWDKGLIYEDYKSMHICPRCETTLAQAEVTEGYKDTKDLSVTVKFELEGEPGTYILAWTTTPWTLIGNAALAVGKDIKYFLCLIKNLENGRMEKYIFSDSYFEKFIEIMEKLHGRLSGDADINNEKLLSNIKRQGCKYVFEKLDEFKGKKLEGKEYKPLFNYYEYYKKQGKYGYPERPESQLDPITGRKIEDGFLKEFEDGQPIPHDKDYEERNKWKNAYTIQLADFVSTEDGTGIVHIAPAFGEDDMNLGKEKHLPFIQHVKMDGTFTEEVRDFRGMHVKPKENPAATDKKIIEFLEKKNLVFSSEEYTHSYPFCWRCESPLLNYATSSWFVAVTKIKPRMLELAKKIYWMPSHIKEGRFGNWLEGARDWAISRQRFWGSVIPIWVCEKCGEKKVFGSVAELEKASNKKVTDLHKHIVDEIVVPCEKCRGAMKRIPDVLDCWFESGSMPYAQQHYPFENNEKFEHIFPAEFIAEGVDQTIKWFYYLHVIATAIKGDIAFENVVVNGIVLAQDGKKMSKRLKNYPSPEEIFDKFGADAMRYYLVTSGVVKAEDMRFSEKEVVEVYRNVFVLLDNVLKFYKSYATATVGRKAVSSILDQWILARLSQLTKEVTENLDAYDLIKSSRPIEEFIQDLSTWYLRRSRERFKNGDVAGIQVFGRVLLELSKLMAPFTPFIAEHVYKEVGHSTSSGLKESVHLEDWPKVQKVEETILSEMQRARQVVAAGLAQRMAAGIKIRQPLAAVTGPKISNELQVIVREELNVNEYRVGNEVVLDIKLTDALKVSGLARELIRAINALRKDAGLTIGDSITITYEGNLEDVLAAHCEEILSKTRAAEIRQGSGGEAVTLNDRTVKLQIVKK